MEFRRVLFRSTGNRARRTGDCASRRLRRRGGATARDRALCRGKGPLMRVGVYPGTFDPITLGHMDIIRRGAKLVDRLVIGVTTNITKSPRFDDDERIALVKAEVATMSGAVRVR